MTRNISSRFPALGQTASFYYREKTVDSIIKWTEPVTVGATTQTEVTYTYKIANLAPWALVSKYSANSGMCA